MTRDLTTEGPVPGQERIDVDHCETCPFSACLICGYKGGTWGAEGRPE